MISNDRISSTGNQKVIEFFISQPTHSVFCDEPSTHGFTHHRYSFNCKIKSDRVSCGPWLTAYHQLFASEGGIIDWDQKSWVKDGGPCCILGRILLNWEKFSAEPESLRDTDFVYQMLHGREFDTSIRRNSEAFASFWRCFVSLVARDTIKYGIA